MSLGQKYISPYDQYCYGYSGDSNHIDGYIFGISIGVGVTESKLSHPGSTLLDELNAFDLSEIDGPYLGQLNMSIVSSFCGPHGLIWGYDIANNLSNRTKYAELSIDRVFFEGKNIDVYNGNFLVDALLALFGTISHKRYHIYPGSHVPFASKNIKVTSPCSIYSALALGIPADRENSACLLMEDVGFVDKDYGQPNKAQIITKLAESVIQIGINQHVDYKEAMIIYIHTEVKQGETGCALVAAPYFTLAKNAIPRDIFRRLNFNKLCRLTLDDWLKDFPHFP